MCVVKLGLRALSPVSVLWVLYSLPGGSLVLCLALMRVCLFRPTNVVWLGRYRWKSK